MNIKGIRQNALILTWSLYDLANQFFALNIVSLYFVRWVTIEKGLPEIFYSVAFGISTFFVAVSTPILGAISDLLNRRMFFLNLFTLFSVIFTMMLGISKYVFISLIFFAMANFGCQTAVVFYNALLSNIAPKDKVGLISGIGRMFGYIGALLALYMTRPYALRKDYHQIFFLSAFCFLVFAAPSMLFIKDKDPYKIRVKLSSFLKKEKFLEILTNLKTTLFDYKAIGLINFLKASFCGLCAVNVIIIFMSVYATVVFKITEIQLINFVILSTLFAILGSFISGNITDYLGIKKSLTVLFVLWISVVSLAAWIKNMSLYWFIAWFGGLALGSTWTVLRAMVVYFVPKDKIGKIFGLFNLMGYISAIVGSLFWGVILLLFLRWGVIRYRISLFSLNLFFLLGLVFLHRDQK
ncbi:MAG: MFS transporter [Candidatus Omnitrophica bacterium]|nr:MFS transporter [Candidatus Omnitrophota bacterium]